MRIFLLCFLVLMRCTVICAQNNAGPQNEKMMEWRSYGGDAGGARFSLLRQVNEKNVSALEKAWEYHTGELATYAGTRLAEKSAFEATPVMAGGVLYFSTPTSRVIALDAATGKQLWIYDPAIDKKADYSEVTSRGVSIWPATNDSVNKMRAKRILVATLDGRLIALNARTGQPVTEFGYQGQVNLREGFGRELSVTSPPAVIGDVVVVGSSMGDNQKIDYPRGTVRAYDAVEGKLLWKWNPIPDDDADLAWKTWEGFTTTITGAANAWAVISADPERGLIYVPTSCPAPDYYGGERLGQNLYANSIVALDAKTGKLAWHYQVVHHDIWDYDIAAQPVLIDLLINNRKRSAVAVGTKMGHVFILDRQSGKPLFPVEEKPVPASTVPGEKTWPTQPTPLLPAPVGLQQVTLQEAWGPTEADKRVAAEKIGRLESAGAFTPPSFTGSIIAPGNIGGIHWGGMSFDPQQQLLITNINRLAAVIRLIPRAELAGKEKEDPSLVRNETGRQAGTPYVMKRSYLFAPTPDGLLMQTQPPWGTVLAIDLKTGQKKWEVPLGYMMDTVKYPLATQWGSINLGGAITTAGNLTIVAASMDGHLRVFNTATGVLLWQAALPAGGQATPMTYSVNGKQYIVIAAGGHGKLGTRPGDSLVAFALPE